MRLKTYDNYKSGVGEDISYRKITIFENLREIEWKNLTKPYIIQSVLVDMGDQRINTKVV